LITFDDGYRNFFQTAVPLLRQFGFTATVFMPVDYIGKPPLWLERDRALTERLLDEVGLSVQQRRALVISTPACLPVPPLGWSELRELTEAGFDIQSHSAGHHFLTRLPPAELAEDLVRSREVLKDHLGVPVSAIAYPYGVSNPEVAAAARAAGFE